LAVLCILSSKVLGTTEVSKSPLLSLITIDQKPLKTDQPKLKKTKIEFIPYQATYKIELDKTAPFDQGIKDVKGTQTIRCELIMHDQNGAGYKTSQKATLFIYYHDKDAADKYEHTCESFESTDGKIYNFQTRSVINDNNDETLSEGEAKFLNRKHDRVEEDGVVKESEVVEESEVKGYVSFDKPVKKIIQLPEKTLFPIHHLLHILNHAAEGKDSVNYKKIFDGSSDLLDVAEIDATLEAKPRYKLNTLTSSDSKSKDPEIENFAKQLEAAKVWKIKMNVFSGGNRDFPDPDYSYTQTVNSLGVIIAMNVKYVEPEFNVNITLTDFGKIEQPN
jgi:hypothetical protein